MTEQAKTVPVKDEMGNIIGSAVVHRDAQGNHLVIYGSVTMKALEEPVEAFSIETANGEPEDR